MDEFLKMDVFFLVTTVAVVVLTILLTIIFLRVIRILQNVERISLMVEAEGQHLRDDIAEVRSRVKSEGVKISHLFDFLGAGRKKRTRAPKSES
jgi:hypothetical protein